MVFLVFLLTVESRDQLMREVSVDMVSWKLVCLVLVLVFSMEKVDMVLVSWPALKVCVLE